MKVNTVYLNFAIFFYISTEIYCANILFVTTFPSISHQAAFQPVWKELSLRGHKVTAITPNPLNDTSLTNLTEIDLGFLYAGLKQKTGSRLGYYMLQKPGFFLVFLKDGIMTYMIHKMTEKIFEHENVQRFLKEDHHFDVVIVEWLYPTMAALGAKYNAPIVGITSLGAPVVALDTVGNPSHPLVAPDHNLPVTRDMPFRERLLSALYSVYVRIYYHLVVLPGEDKLAKRFLGDDLPYLGDIERNISLLLLTENSVIHRPIPVVPAVIELNGIQPTKKKQTLDPELKEFLDNSKNGVIYFSLGSNARSSFLSDSQRNAFITVFSNLSQNVIWKIDSDDTAIKADTKKVDTKNILLKTWVPQAALLAHKNVKLFITQGGLQSTEETITHQVPIIGIPFHSDQTANVDSCVKHGMGVLLEFDDITIDSLNASIYKILNNPSYKENAVRLSKLLYDKPSDGVEKAVWWIEYVIRHKGAKHLRSHAMDIPWYQYLFLDIIGFILTIILILFTIMYAAIKIVFIVLAKIFQKKKNCAN